jgi:chromate reductase
MTAPLCILGLSGSLRKNSYNTALLRVAREVAPEGVEVAIAELADLPIYNADVEAAGMPEAVERLRGTIKAADALLFATPEYNYSVPAALKNAIDWASRPPGDSALTGKPIGIMGAGGGLGTARAQYHLRQIALGTNMLALARPEVFVSNARTKFDAEGRLTDEAARELIRALVAGLAAWTRRLRAGG